MTEGVGIVSESYGPLTLPAPRGLKGTRLLVDSPQELFFLLLLPGAPGTLVAWSRFVIVKAR
jgi:hypothetical protein